MSPSEEELTSKAIDLYECLVNHFERYHIISSELNLDQLCGKVEKLMKDYEII